MEKEKAERLQREAEEERKRKEEETRKKEAMNNMTHMWSKDGGYLNQGHRRGRKRETEREKKRKLLTG